MKTNQDKQNYYIIRAGVKRTLELARFVQSEAKLTTSCWYYTLELEDKERLIILADKAEVAADQLVRALKNYYNAVNDMIVPGAREKASQEVSQLTMDRFNTRFEKVDEEENL